MLVALKIVMSCMEAKRGLVVVPTELDGAEGLGAKGKKIQCFRAEMFERDGGVTRGSSDHGEDG